MPIPMHKTSSCISRPWSNSATHRPTTVPMPEKVGKDSNPNPNLKLLPMTETGKPKTTKKLPSKLDWKTPSPSRCRPLKPQQHQYKNPLRISRMEGSNPTLPNTHLVDTGMYTARRNRGSPQPPVPSRRRHRRLRGLDGTGGWGEPAKSSPEEQSLSVRPLFYCRWGTTRFAVLVPSWELDVGHWAWRLDGMGCEREEWAGSPRQCRTHMGRRP